MGNYCLATSNANKWRNGDQFIKHPGQSNETLTFRFSISNIELRNPPKNFSSLSVQIPNSLKWNCKKIKGLDVLSVSFQLIQWKQQRDLDIKATEPELSEMFLIFRIQDHQGFELGILPLNMFLILTGPWRHDFVIRYNNEETGRLRADIKCTQLIHVEMKAIKVDVDFLNQHPNEMFHFSLKTEDLTGNPCQENESYQIETISKTKYPNRETQSQTLQTKRLQWTNLRSQRQHNKQLPSFKLPVIVDSISNYSFRFVLWKSQNNTFQPYGQTNVPFPKLFWTDIKESNLNPEVGGTRDIEINESIQFMGKKIGDLVLHCKVTTPKFFQQVLTLTRTESGMTNAKRVMSNCQTQCNNLKTMAKIKNSILDNIIKSGNVKNQLTEKGMKEYREHKLNVYQDTLKLEKVFEKDMPKYSKQDLIKVQWEIIDIIDKLLPLTELREIDIVEAIYRCMQTILFRGEFLLENVGFTEKEIQQMKGKPRGSLAKALQQRVAVAESYQGILLKLLIISLSKLERKSLPEEMSFISTILTIGYYKIPEFQSQLLKQVQYTKDETRVYCYQKSQSRDDIEKLANWQEMFSKPLSIYQINRPSFTQFWNLKKWRSVIKKRQFSFFALLQNWAQNTSKVLGISGSVQHYKAIPGYNTMTGSFLHEMKSRRIQEYPDTMKDANMALLSNECLFPIFIRILVEKTNTYNIAETLKSLELVGAYFAHFSYYNKILPSCFDTRLFYLFIKHILISQNVFVTTKILQIIYLYFPIFSNQLKRQLSMMLMGRYFFTFMLNWAKGVREMFKYLLVFRILRWVQQTKVVDITSRWNILKDMLGMITQKGEKTIPIYHQRMKHNLAKKRKASSTKTLPSDTLYLFDQQPLPQIDQIKHKSLQMEETYHQLHRRNSNPQQMAVMRKNSDFDVVEIEGVCYAQYYKEEMMRVQQVFRVWRERGESSVPRVDISRPIEGDI